MPHTTVPAAIPVVLKIMQTSSVPAKATRVFLESNGVGAGQGSHVVGFLRALGFVDGASRPTLLWRRYRRPDHARVELAAAIRQAYAPLFERFTDAPHRNTAEISKVIRRHTEYSEHHVGRTAECFLTLCEYADFSIPLIPSATTPPSAVVQMSVHERLVAMRRLTAAHQEALECLRHGLHRPAYVSIWNGYVALALTMLATNDFAAVRAVRPSWTGTTIEDLSTQTPGALLLEMLLALKLCDSAEIDELGIHLQGRNDSAHPTFFTPSRDETSDYIADVVEAALMLIDRVDEPH